MFINYLEPQQDALQSDELENAKCVILSNQTINIQNCLALNQNYTSHLLNLKAKLEADLAECEEKYKANEELLISNTRLQTNACPLLRLTKRSFGYPFFKTENGNFPPASDEGAYRKYERQLFPCDFLTFIKTRWTLSDKSLLVKVVKEQIRTANVTKSKAVAAPKRIKLENGQTIAVEIIHNFPINWEEVSFSLFNRHNRYECEAMWEQYLKPDVRKLAWSDEESQALVNAVKKNKCQNWTEISKAIPKRSAFQCFVQYQTTFNGLHTGKNKFTAAEDERLLELVEKHRISNVITWSKVAEDFGTRTKFALYYRYVFTLKPTINKEPFTMEEDCIFLAAIEQYGLNFQKIATEFPNRTMVQIRQHYNNVLKDDKRNMKPWTHDEDALLLEQHDKKKTWAEIATMLGTHTRLSCRSRFLTIKRFLEKHPGKTVRDVTTRKRGTKNGINKDNWVDKIVFEIGQMVPIAETFVDVVKPSPRYQKEVKQFVKMVRILDVNLNHHNLTDELVLNKYTMLEKQMIQSARKEFAKPVKDAVVYDDPLPVTKDSLRGYKNIKLLINSLADSESHKRNKPVMKKVAIFNDRTRKVFKSAVELVQETRRKNTDNAK